MCVMLCFLGPNAEHWRANGTITFSMKAQNKHKDSLKAWAISLPWSPDNAQLRFLPS